MKKILYVEDDAVNALIVEKLLNKIYHIQIARNETACMERIQAEIFDLILMDINLGEKKMKGVEILKTIKNIPAYTHIKVVAVTAFALPEEQAYFAEVGFDGYISKPIEENVLKDLLSAMLKE